MHPGTTSVQKRLDRHTTLLKSEIKCFKHNSLGIKGQLTVLECQSIPPYEIQWAKTGMYLQKSNRVAQQVPMFTGRKLQLYIVQ
jgi:hypothetical protein